MNVNSVPRHYLIDLRQEIVKTPGSLVSTWDTRITNIVKFVWWSPFVVYEHMVKYGEMRISIA